jgi:preprotein translocase subunit SecA
MTAPKYTHKKMTEAEAQALLNRIAPHWREHLRDGHVIEQIIHGVKCLNRRYGAIKNG